MPAYDVVGLGANSVDHVHVVPVLPAPGPHDKVRINSSETFAGGQVATMVAACAMFGLRARYLGPFGTDARKLRRSHTGPLCVSLGAAGAMASIPTLEELGES